MRKVFFPQLDSLRFFAFFAVFVSHLFFTEDPALVNHPVIRFLDRASSIGALGVNFFFVLSGFLITYLLLEELKSEGRIHIGAFYMRRVLRIWPLYYLILLIGFVLFPLLKGRLGLQPVESANVWRYLLFLGNFDIIANGVTPDASMLGVLWSLAVEEQFYLFWPLLLAALPVAHYPKLFAAIIALSVGARFFNHDRSLWMAHSTFSVGSDLVVGAGLAYYSHRGALALTWLKRLRAGHIIAIYVVGITSVALLFDVPHPLSSVSRLLTSLFFAFVIWEQNESPHSPFKLGRLRVCAALGKITYGLYCLHFVGILAAIHLNRLVLHLNKTWWQVVCVESGMAFAFSVAFSVVCYRYLEQPFLRLKNQFSPGVPAVAVRGLAKG
ncbi:MAG TPA: acyltransferase [Polyangia bacterium]